MTLVCFSQVTTFKGGINHLAVTHWPSLSHCIAVDNSRMSVSRMNYLYPFLRALSISSVRITFSSLHDNQMTASKLNASDIIPITFQSNCVFSSVTICNSISSSYGKHFLIHYTIRESPPHHWNKQPLKGKNKQKKNNKKNKRWLLFHIQPFVLAQLLHSSFFFVYSHCAGCQTRDPRPLLEQS